MDEKWIKDLQNRMEKHTESAPDGLWESIEQRMSNLAIEQHLAKKRILFRRRLGWVASVAATILFCLFGTYLLSDQEYATINEELLVNQDGGERSLLAMGVDSIEKEFASEGYLALIEAETKELKGIEKQTKGKKREGNIQDKRSVEHHLNNKGYKKKSSNFAHFKEDKKTTSQIDSKLYRSEQKSTSREAELNEKKNSVKSLKSTDRFPDDGAYDSLLATLDKRVDSSSNSGVDLGLYASNSPIQAEDTYKGYGVINRGAVVYEEGQLNALKGNPALSDIVNYNNEKRTYTSIDHKQPITVGLSVSYSVNKRWAIDAGLNYSLLLSSLKSGTDLYFYDSKQALHFLGIPLAVRYTIWSGNNFACYTSAGGEVQRLIAGRLTTDYIHNGKLNKTEKESIAESKLYWSAKLAVGVQYNISELFGIYFEPSFNYHFDNGSDLETIFAEKRANLGLKLGFRFNL